MAGWNKRTRDDLLRQALVKAEGQGEAYNHERYKKMFDENRKLTTAEESDVFSYTANEWNPKKKVWE